jgi:hypothetical protein
MRRFGKSDRRLLFMQAAVVLTAIDFQWAYGVRTKPSRASASYSLCLLQPLLMVAAT